MAFGNRFTYWEGASPTHFWDLEHPPNVPVDITKIQADFGTIISGYTISGDLCTDMYFYFGDSYPAPLVASYESGSYLASIDYTIPAILEGSTRYYLKATFENCTDYGDSITYEGYFDTESTGPSKAINPTPSNTTDDVTLDHPTVTWEDGGGAETYDVYYGTESGNLTLVSSAQSGTSFTIWGIDNGSPFNYEAVRYWRVDATNEYGTTTGDEWSFTSIEFDPPKITYDLIDGGSGLGPYDGGIEGTDWKWTGYNNIITNYRIVGVADDCFWYGE